MLTKTLKTITNAIKKGDFVSKIFCWVFIKMGYSNMAIQALEVRNKNYLYLERHYGKICNEIIKSNRDKKFSCNEFEENYNVWFCWLQGLEEAPDIVKRCYESGKINLNEKKLHFITKKNLSEYISFPVWIIEKWEKGIISNTCMSDMIRLQLLIKYGGLWIDATTYLTGPIPEYITMNELFMYTHSSQDDITISFNNWLIYAEKGNFILKSIRDMMFEYWKKETKIREYFIFHLFVTMIKKRCPKEFESIPYISDEIPEMLAKVCFKAYNEEFWLELKKITSIHKLSTKFAVPEKYEGTYYDYLIKNIGINDNGKI